jgi:hypothetical protein
MSFLKWLVNRRFPAPVDPKQDLPIVKSTARARMEGTTMLIRFLTGPRMGQTDHAEKSQTTKLLIDAGMIEVVEPPAPERARPKWHVGTTHFGDKTVLWLVTPVIGERVPFTGAPEDAESFFGLNYGHCLPIPEQVLQAYSAARGHQEKVTVANEAAKHAPQPTQENARRWNYPTNY